MFIFNIAVQTWVIKYIRDYLIRLHIPFHCDKPITKDRIHFLCSGAWLTLSIYILVFKIINWSHKLSYGDIKVIITFAYGVTLSACNCISAKTHYELMCPNKCVLIFEKKHRLNKYIYNILQKCVQRKGCVENEQSSDSFTERSFQKTRQTFVGTKQN